QPTLCRTAHTGTVAIPSLGLGKSCVIREHDEQVRSPFPVMTVNAALRDYLKTRRTVTAPFLAEPGPDANALAELLTIACRVPDHGKLAPWRFMIFQGDARQKASERLFEIAERKWPDRTPEQLAAERAQFMPAPLTVGVISTAAPHVKIPEFEQLLAA